MGPFERATSGAGGGPVRTALPVRLYRAAEVRAMDRLAIEGHGIPGIDLMERAGRRVFDACRHAWPAARELAVLCGAGNNGGDGFVVARLALEAGLACRVLLAGERGRVRGDAAGALARLLDAGGRVQEGDVAPPAHADLVVDALFGTGLDRPPAGHAAALIAWANGCGAPIAAVDVPSGLHADTGAMLGEAIRASLTVTFIGLKQGLLTGDGPACCGRVLFDDLGVPDAVAEGTPPAAERVDLELLKECLAPRPRSAHKGTFGHVLVVGGEQGFAGAARLAGEAAARTGAGLVSIATRAAHAAFVTAARPELMCRGVETPAELTALLERATVVAAGPGLGQGAWGRAMLAAVLAARRPLVLDADALNVLATGEGVCREGDGYVLTPHPGEAARLLGCSTRAVQADRFAAASALVERHGGVCVLKGAGTLIASRGRLPAVCSDGNPGMASGGMGDVLTGVIAALLAQGHAPRAAAVLGVCLHARAADCAAGEGERGLLAGDLMAPLRNLCNPR